MSRRDELQANPPQRFYSVHEVSGMLEDDFDEPCCSGSDDELSAEEIPDMPGCESERLANTTV